MIVDARKKCDEIVNSKIREMSDVLMVNFFKLSQQQGSEPDKKTGFRIGFGLRIFGIFRFGFELGSEKSEIQTRTQTRKSDTQTQLFGFGPVLNSLKSNIRIYCYL